MTVAISLEGVHVIDSREKVPLAPPRWDLREVSERKGAGPLLRLSWFPGVCGWLGAGWMTCLGGPLSPSDVRGAFTGILGAFLGLLRVCFSAQWPLQGVCSWE